MKILKLTILTTSLALSSGLLANAAERINIEVILGTRPPSPNERNLMKMEEEKHPNLVKAMHSIELAIRDLEAAPEDFGGNKVEALQDLKKSFHSIRKALYFRLLADTH